MKLLPLLGLASAVLAGFLTGNRMGTGNESTQIAQPAVTRPVPEAVGPASAKVVARRSGDSLDDLKSLPGAELYSRLALWLVDASAEEIAACWGAIGKGARREVVELIMLNWTRLDPRAALVAVRGGEHEYHAWRGWACNDPEAAMAAAAEDGQQRIERVGSAIGEFHPDWVREHWDEVPFAARWYAIQGMSSFRETLDPWEDVEFAKERKMPVDRRQLQTLVRDDPWRALDWIREKGWEAGPVPYDPEDVFFSTLADEHPEVLETMAARAPAGAEKRKMEALLFDRLLESDPEAAIRATDEVEAQIVKARQQAAIALNLLVDEPERGRELAIELLAERGGLHGRVQRRGGHGEGIPELNQLAERMIRDHPEATLEAVRIDALSATPDQGMLDLSRKWAERDPDGLAEWIARTEDPARRDQALVSLVGNLTYRDPESAFEWLKAYPEARWAHQMNPFVYQRMIELQPEAARAALEDPELPAAMREKLEQELSKSP